MKRTTVVLGVLCALLGGELEAQIQQGLEYTITPYMWGTALDGSVQMGSVGADVDASFSDLLDILEVTVPIHFEAKGPVWTLLADVNYVSLSQDLAAGPPASGTLDVDMLIAELLSGYQVSDVFELLFGARYVDIENTLRFQVGPNPRRRFDAGQDWIDPVVGFRYGGPISRRWSFALRGDLGGFGLGSELTWNVRTGFGVDISEVTTLRFGWHVTDFDYDSNNFVYDMTHSGPEIGASFRF